jgi:hypothetical protein
VLEWLLSESLKDRYGLARADRIRQRSASLGHSTKARKLLTITIWTASNICRMRVTGQESCCGM